MNKIKIVCLFGLLIAVAVFSAGAYLMNADANPIAPMSVFMTHLTVTVSGIGIFAVFGAGLQHQIEKEYWQK